MARHERILPVRPMAQDEIDEDPIRDVGDDDEDEEFEDAEEEPFDEDDDLDEELVRDNRPAPEVRSKPGTARNVMRTRPDAGRTKGSGATRTGRPSGRDR
jgi:hypothetical protein